MSETHDSGASSGDDAFVITRVFHAPADAVFAAWTDPGQLLTWFGPAGFTVTPKTVDVRPHGSFHYAMRTPVGQVVWGHWAFREVAAPARLAFLATFSDEAGGLGRNPWTPIWPAQVLTTVTLHEQDGRTTLTMHATPVDATEPEHAAFRAAHGSMHMGWTATLGQLAGHLSKA